jgi:2-methylcitrate dehydratase PrpD
MLASPSVSPEIRQQAEFAQTYAEFSASLRGKDLPPGVMQAAKANLFDTVACAIAGSNAPGVAEVRDLAVSWGGTPQAAIWCSQSRVPAHHAAWVNGMMAHARDFDDTHDAAVLHAGVSVIPAALAAASLRPEATGDDLLSGIVAGLELVCRLGIATTIGIIESGFIYTSLFGYFGATAAAARVLGLDARQTMNAIGIAYSQAAGTHQVTRDAALTKRMQPGFAAKAALMSVQLAQRGIRGAQNTFDGADGLFRTYLRDGYDPVVLRDGLGQRFEMMELSYKPYPCCRFDHTAIDAALAVRAQLGFDIAHIERITVGVNHQAYQAVCTPPAMRRHPTTGVQAQFSIPFTVACALVDGRVSLNHFTDEALRRPDILAIAAKVECAIDDNIERLWSRNISPTELVVESGHTTFRQRADYPRGHTRFPMTTADFDSKLDDCIAFSALGWPPGMAGTLRTTIGGLEHLEQADAINSILKFDADTGRSA